MSADALQVQNVVVELSSDAAAKLWEDQINKSLIHLAHGSTSSEKQGAIVAIGACMHIAFKHNDN